MVKDERIDRRGPGVGGQLRSRRSAVLPRSALGEHRLAEGREENI